MSVPAAMGHNNPPPLKEILAANYAHFTHEIEAIAERANRAPKAVKSDDDLDAVGVIVKDARAMAKRVDTARKDEKEPYLQAGRDVDAFFKALTERLDRIASVLEDRATEYQRAKAAEARRKAEEEARKLREAEEAAAAGRAAIADRAEAKAETLADKAAEAERLAEARAADLARARGASGTLASAKTVTKVRIVDLALVQSSMGPLGPYIDSEMIQKAANTWLRVTKGKGSIPGLEVYEDVRATFR